MLIGIIIGASPIGGERKKFNELLIENEKDNCCIIAADGGIHFLYDLNICPDEWIGDMDSAGVELVYKVREKFPDINVNPCSPIKDDTDTAIAANILVKKGCKSIYIFGGMGGRRVEHSIANIQLMHHLADKGIKVTLYSEESVMYCVKDDVVYYDETEKGFISIFSLTDTSRVEIEGLFYQYNGIISNSYALGISNEFVGKAAKIKVSEGVILIVLGDGP